MATKKAFFKAVYVIVVAQAGIEPATQGFSVLCSTNWATGPLDKKVADHMGIEPTIFSVTGRHVNRYTNGPHCLQLLIDAIYIINDIKIKIKTDFAF